MLSSEKEDLNEKEAKKITPSAKNVEVLIALKSLKNASYSYANIVKN
jgi:hypothetical protein